MPRFRNTTTGEEVEADVAPAGYPWIDTAAPTQTVAGAFAPTEPAATFNASSPPDAGTPDQAPTVDTERTIDEIMAEVGDDPARARAALDAENASDKPRSTLVSKLEGIAGE